MTYITKPKVSHPSSKPNSIGLTRRDYEGGLSSLCGGCGHDSVTSAIITAFYDLAIPPHRVAKMSGIGCSSKTPGYFLNEAHGFNSVHGRMPSVTTGAHLANASLYYIGISGDGDTGSIGVGQFLHTVRRNLNMLYIVENNGVYGLTKGQFSALADSSSKGKSGQINPFPGIDIAELAIQTGAGFVARGFSGDKGQLIPLIKAGLEYPGFALIDVISPCVTFNNHQGSTKSYDYSRDHYEELNDIDLVTPKDEIDVGQETGQSYKVKLHDETYLNITKYNHSDHLSSRLSAIQVLYDAKKHNKVVTGLLYIDEKQSDLKANLQLPETPLRDLKSQELCPGSKILSEIMDQFA